MWRSHRRHRWQASSHRIPVHPQKQAGWQAAIADKTAPTGFRYIHKNRSAGRPPSLAKQLPQDSGTSSRTGRLSARHRWQASSHRIPVHPQKQVGCQPAIAGRPAPTGFRYIHKNRPAVSPPSLAKQLPQDSGTSARTGPLSGSHRWQASSHRIPVHPQEQAGCQAAIAGRPAPTGFRYIHKNRPAVRPPSLAKQLPQDSGTSTRTGRLAGRHRWQNSSHRIPVHPQEQVGWQASSHGIPVHPQEQVGWQAAIAGRPAPTGFRYIRRNRPAGRPPSLAKQLPQDSGTSARTGRLAGRHRWQASSHRIPVPPQEQVGWQAAIAGKTAPTGFRHIHKNRSAVRPPSHAMDQRPHPPNHEAER